LARFGTLSQVVGFFRAFSQEQSLDAILPTLRIVKARSQLQGLELLVEFPSQGSHLLDRAAAIARLLRGEVFTGRAPHYVRYRDANAPFGYDAQRLVAVREGLVLYNQTGELGFREEGEIAFRGLLLNLSLGVKRGAEPAAALYLRTPPGLHAPVQRFLWERQIPAAVALLTRKAGGRFDAGESFCLFRVDAFPARLLPLFSKIPGVELYHARRPNVFVQRGWAHPFALESCRKALDDAALYFFSGERGVVDQVEGEAIFVDIESLKGVEVQDPALRPDREARLLREGGQPPQGWSAQQLREVLRYPVNLIRKGQSAELATALFLKTGQEMGWLKRLVYALPSAALDQHRMAVTDHGCVIVNRQGVDAIPLGLKLREVFAGVFVPWDAHFSPPLSREQLQAHWGLEAGRCYFLPQGLSGAFWVAEDALQPLARHLLAEVALDEAVVAEAKPMGVREAVELINEDVGYFALWGHNWRGASLEGAGAPTQPMRALPPADGGERG
jgi:hypothetical protein